MVIDVCKGCFNTSATHEPNEFHIALMRTSTIHYFLGITRERRTTTFCGYVELLGTSAKVFCKRSKCVCTHSPCVLCTIPVE